MIHLLEIDIRTPEGVETTLRYATDPGYSHPTAPGYYDPRITRDAEFSHQVFEGIKEYGNGSAGAGEIILDNRDGELDPLINYGYGRGLRLFSGNEDTPYSEMTLMMKGIANHAKVEVSNKEDTVSIGFQDRTTELDVPISTTQRLIGSVSNLAPILVDEARGIYQIHEGAVTTISAAYDGGNPLSYQSNYATRSELENASVSQGYFSTCLAEGLLRVGSLPVYVLTCDGAATYIDVPAIIEDLLEDAGVSEADINSTDLAALPFMTAGYYVQNGETYRDVIRQLLGSINAWMAPNRLGQYRFYQLGDATASPQVNFSFLPESILDQPMDTLELISTPTESLPSKEVICHYAHLGRTLSRGEQVQGVLTEATRTYLETGYKQVSSGINQTIQSVYPYAGTLTFTLHLQHDADAQAICALREQFHSQLRHVFRFTTPMNPDTLGLSIGDVVAIKTDRLGMENGQNAWITGFTYDLEKQVMEVTCLM